MRPVNHRTHLREEVDKLLLLFYPYDRQDCNCAVNSLFSNKINGRTSEILKQTTAFNLLSAVRSLIFWKHFSIIQHRCADTTPQSGTTEGFSDTATPPSLFRFIEVIQETDIGCCIHLCMSASWTAFSSLSCEDTHDCPDNKKIIMISEGFPEEIWFEL